MRKYLSKYLFLCLGLVALATSANAQDSEQSTAKKTLKTGKKVVVVVVGRTAKLTYKATKFSADKIAKPIIVKSAPKVAGFALKQTGKTIKTSFPVVKKLFIQYVKYKFLP